MKADNLVGMQQLSPQNPGETGYRNRFYAVVDGVIYAGDEQGVTRDDSPRWKAGRGVSRKLEPLFRGFEREAESVESVEALDPESREGLRALGYLR